MADPVVHALVPAAGRGQRFGDVLLKQYADIASRPVLAHEHVIVDLSELTFLDCGGYGALVEVSVLLSRQGRTLSITGRGRASFS